MPKTYGLNKSKNFRQSYYADCLMGDDWMGYHIYADYDHDLKKWIVYCEDHEPSELAKMYPDTYKENGFNSLYDASVFIWEFVDDYYSLWEENNKDDQSTADTEDTTMLNLMLHDQPLETLIYLRDSLIESYNTGSMHSYELKRYPETLNAYNQAIAIKQQCPDLSPMECATIANTLDNKQQCPDLSVDDTVTKFIDSDPDSDLSCDLYQIFWPETYLAWLNSGLSRSQFVETVYYAS